MAFCIICLKNEGDPKFMVKLDTLLSIDTKYEISLQHLIHLVTNIKLDFIGDRSQVCMDCVTRIKDACNLIQLCSAAYQRQVELLNQTNKEIPVQIELEEIIKHEDNSMHIYTSKASISNGHVENSSTPNEHLVLYEEPLNGLPKENATTDILIFHVDHGHITESQGDNIILFNIKETDKPLAQKEYNCANCNFVTTILEELPKHMNKEHSKEKILVSVERANETRHKSDVTKKVGDTKKSFRQCPICKKRFSPKTSVSKHIARIHPTLYAKSAYACYRCPKLFSCSSRLKKHVLNMHSRKTPERNILDESPNLHAERKYKDKTKGSKLQQKSCPICKQVFSPKTDLNKHIRNVHAKDAYACSRCRKRFHTSYRLKQHELNMHSYTSDGNVLEESRNSKYRDKCKLPRPPERSCPICKKVFSRFPNLQRHLRRVHKRTRKYHACSLCTKFFNSPSRLAYHTLNAHSDYNRESSIEEETFNPLSGTEYQCSICDFVTTIIEDLPTHLEVVHLQKKIISDDMLNKAIDEQDINKNVIDNRKLIKFGHHTCPVCDKVFLFQRNYRIHMKTFHSKEYFNRSRTYACEHCYSRFKYHARLKEHVLTVHADIAASSNTQETPSPVAEQEHQCDNCDFVTTILEELHKHLEIVHLKEAELVSYEVLNEEIHEPNIIINAEDNVKLFTCSVCNKAYSRRTNLNRHMTSIHATADDKSARNVAQVTLHPLLQKEYKCNYCDFATIAMEELGMHLNNDHSKETILILDETFSEEMNQTDSNENDKENVVKYQQNSICPICARVFSRLTTLRRHMAAIHPTTEFANGRLFAPIPPK